MAKTGRLTTRLVEENLVRANFNTFVQTAFRNVHGEKLGNQPYIEHLCYKISRLIDGEFNRLLVNLPPQHLKSFVGTICLAAYLLGKNPRLRIVLVAYNDPFAAELCERIRDLMSSDWYKRTFETRLKEGHSRANDFKTREGGGVFAASLRGLSQGGPRTSSSTTIRTKSETGTTIASSRKCGKILTRSCRG
jgi:hypothetical protein